MLVFNKPEIVKLAKENFVPVAVELWNLDRQKDGLGEFFRKVVKQSPRQDTSQGIYAVTAAGKVLSWSMDNRRGDKVLVSLRSGLEKWKELPESERKAGVIQIPEQGPLDKNFALKKLPPATQIVKIYARTLVRNMDGELVPNVWTERYLDGCGHGNEASRENAWIMTHEWFALSQVELKEGTKLPLPAAIAERLVRFHFVDSTAGLAWQWDKKEVRISELTLTVLKVGEDRVQLRLDGKVVLATDADLKKANKAFDAVVLGYVDYNPKKKFVEGFRGIAVGDYWFEKTGKAGVNARVPRGRASLGVAFELVRKPGIADLVPPERTKEPGYLTTGGD